MLTVLQSKVAFAQVSIPRRILVPEDGMVSGGQFEKNCFLEFLGSLAFRSSGLRSAHVSGPGTIAEFIVID